MFEDILNYQRKELDLRKLQRELDNLPSRKVVADMVALVKELQIKSINLEKEATELKKTYDNLGVELSKLNEKLDEFDKNCEVEEGIASLTKINNIIINFQTKISKLQTKIEDVLKQFDNAKKKVVMAKTKHKEAKLNIEKNESVLIPKIENLKKEIATLRKDINPVLIKKYEELKADNVMPVFVPKIGNSCGGCRIELSSRGLEKLKQNNHIECEHCRRIIINKD